MYKSEIKVGSLVKNKMSAGVSEWRSLSTQELPYRCQRRLAALLDAPHSRNWKDLLSMMPEYG